jgi:ketosteroid isomerase-like protein
VSSQNLEVMRRARLAFNERDFDRALAECDPQVTWRYPDPYTGPLSFTGHTDVKAFWEKLAHGWARFEVHEDEVLQEGADSLVMAARYLVRGRDSGIEGEMRMFEVARFRDGKMMSFEVFSDRDEALAAARAGE